MRLLKALLTLTVVIAVIATGFLAVGIVAVGFVLFLAVRWVRRLLAGRRSPPIRSTRRTDGTGGHVIDVSATEVPDAALPRSSGAPREPGPP